MRSVSHSIGAEKQIQKKRTSMTSYQKINEKCDKLQIENAKLRSKNRKLKDEVKQLKRENREIRNDLDVFEYRLSRLENSRYIVS